MDLIRLVVASERIHHQVDTRPKRHLSLQLTAGHHRVQRTVGFVESPGASEIIGGDDDRANAVRTPRPRVCVLLRCRALPQPRANRRPICRGNCSSDKKTG